MNSTIEIMKNHISIRKFKDIPVSENIIQEIILAGQSASTSNFAQAYSIIQVDNKETRKVFYDITKSQDQVLNAPLFLVFVADLERARKLTELYEETVDVGSVEAFIISTVDTAIVAQNIMVAAESLGLGGVYIGGIRDNPVLISDILRLPKHTFPVFAMCLGYADETHEKKPRLPLEIILKKEFYDDSNEGTLLKSFDEKIKAYYESRSLNQKSETWTRQMATMFSRKLRPHMKAFLKDQHLNLK
ncbi:MAG: oxygen-insensitive NADPH nitroreductase [Clostridium sp.]|jgi:nitroreductase|nr:oxygen-insensitive NADPH nitroreductase [Clostridium sp.]